MLLADLPGIALVPVDRLPIVGVVFWQLHSLKDRLYSRIVLNSIAVTVSLRLKFIAHKSVGAVVLPSSRFASLVLNTELKMVPV